MSELVCTESVQTLLLTGAQINFLSGCDRVPLQWIFESNQEDSNRTKEWENEILVDWVQFLLSMGIKEDLHGS